MRVSTIGLPPSAQPSGGRDSQKKKSLRGGVALGDGLDGFLNVRYVGGGGEGSDPDEAEDGVGDGYVKNWTSLMAISLGFYFEPSALVR